ncbi:MAG: nucleotidyltransferase domain-containing protein [Casimicrobiaceae bacterium]
MVASNHGAVVSNRRMVVTDRRADLLADALIDVDSVVRSETTDWEALVRRAREGNLLGTLAERIAERSLTDQVPAAPRAHLIAARIRSAAQATAIRRELRHLARALDGVDAQVVLLKGAAYFCAGLRPARGRVFSDIDVLVPKHALLDVESALMQAGFVTTHTNPYDQRYYRQWMHELPPMQHVRRQTVLDVHHALVPETSRMHPDSALLLEEAVPLDESAWMLYRTPRHEAPPPDDTDAQTASTLSETRPRFSVLAPADMAIHCATHLFCDEEFSHATRDLVDFDGLLRQFGSDPDFWTKLVPRARTLELARPLYYALHWSARVHGTPIPAEVMRDARADAPLAPLRHAMNGLLGPALHATRGRASTRWARRALYVRGHWLKMPPHLLAWHLTVKAFRREETTSTDEAPRNEA